MEILIPIVLMLLIVIVLRVSARKDPAAHQYDERQLWIRGNAYRAAFMTVCGFHALYAVIVTVAGRPFMADGVSGAAGLFLGLCVFAVCCIRTGAFFTDTERLKRYLILIAIVLLSQTAGLVPAIRNGELVRDGLLQMNAVQLFCLLCFLVVLIAALVRLAAEKKEADE